MDVSKGTIEPVMPKHSLQIALLGFVLRTTSNVDDLVCIPRRHLHEPWNERMVSLMAFN
jgi:hypothetical protein